MEYNGIFLIDKGIDTTSNDLVRMVKKKFDINKAGHSGTLDPDVTGLVIVAVGNGTRLLPLITNNSQKEYEACILFGKQTDTADISGKVIKESEILKYSDEQIKEVLNSFKGLIKQTPPIYSAKRVNGRRLYDYARNGEEVEIKEVEINIYDIELLEYSVEQLRFKVVVSKGTYIRTLCEDISSKLNMVGTMNYLRRTKTDGFSVSESKTIEDVEKEDIIDSQDFLSKIYNTYEVYGAIKDMISNGAVLNKLDSIKYPCLYIDQETKKAIALYGEHKQNKVKPIIML